MIERYRLDSLEIAVDREALRRESGAGRQRTDLDVPQYFLMHEYPETHRLVVKVAAYIDALDAGLSPEEAAKRAEEAG